MDLLKIGTQLLMQKMNLNVGADVVTSALGGLLGGGNGGNIDIAGLIAKMQGGSGLSSLVGSFLGDGPNETMTEGNIMDVFGAEQIGNFASKIGVGKEEAANGLSDVLPQLLDKASSGGKLLDAVGGAGGLMGAASSFFK